ncbi:MAG: MutS protein msh5 [Vezdaea aestivalis]|nr:MAG: MutS protein msh5 [Vezdaea aestivalis]
MSRKRQAVDRQNESRKRATTASNLASRPSIPTLVGPESSEDFRSDWDNNFANEIVMAVEMKAAGTIGCAYYVAREQRLYFMEDMKSAGFEVLESLKVFIEPTTILSSSRSDVKVSEVFQPRSDGAIGGPFWSNINDKGSLEAGNETISPFRFELRPSSEFNYEGSKQKLINLDIETEYPPSVTLQPAGDGDFDFEPDEEREIQRTSSAQSRLMMLSTTIDIRSQISVGCAGAIISHLQRQRSVRTLPNENQSTSAFRITSLEAFTLRSQMMISHETLIALQVLNSEPHPHAHNQGPARQSSGAKEGLSVFGLFQRFARSPQGKLRLRQCFLRPSTEHQVIGRRLDALSILCRPENSTTVENLSKCMIKVKNIRGVMIQLRKGITDTPVWNTGMNRGVWPSLQKFCFQILKVREFLAELNGREYLWIYDDLMEAFDISSFTVVGQIISRTVDFEASQQQHRTVVKPGIDTDLDEIKRQYDGMNDLLATITQNIANSIDEEITDLNTIYFPQIGFLLAIPIGRESTRRPATRHGKDGEPWFLQFSSEHTGYYKSPEMRDMDFEFGDIQSDICDREIEITVKLAQKIIQYERLILESSDMCGELDCLLALAKGAEYYKLARPTISKNNVIRIRDGRHLLQELTVDSYVSNDAVLVGGQGEEDDESQLNQNGSDQIEGSVPTEPSMLLMTGPNYSGKSVFLKQIALIVYLAQIGSFVPALSAEIGITDKILSRIATLETVSKARSSFVLDLQQIVQALTLATNRSLILIDEFGKGTNSCDGAGLACGVFEYLLNLGSQRPKVIAATHFHEIFEARFLSPRPELMLGQMEVRVDMAEDAELENQVTYLYSFLPERSRASFGTLCAKLNGIDPAIVERANDLSLLAAQGENLVDACSMMSENDQQEIDRAEIAVRQFLQRDIADPTLDDSEGDWTLKEFLATIL